MKQYVFWYSETDTYKAYFEAENREQAESMLKNVFEGDGSLSDLPNFGATGKDYDAEYSPETLQEIGQGK